MSEAHNEEDSFVLPDLDDDNESSQDVPETGENTFDENLGSEVAFLESLEDEQSVFPDDVIDDDDESGEEAEDEDELNDGVAQSSSSDKQLGFSNQEPDEAEDEDTSAPLQRIQEQTRAWIVHIWSYIWHAMTVVGHVLWQLPLKRKLLVGGCVVGVVLVFLGVRLLTSQEDTPSQDLPDRGKVVMSDDYTIDKSTDTLHVTLQNDGATIAKVTPSATLYATYVTHVGSWFAPQQTAQCTSQLVKIDIDQTKDVVMKCSHIDGFSLQVNGEIDG